MRTGFIDWCKENNLENILDEWNTEINGDIDTKLSYGSEKKVSWTCKHNHTWVASINQRTSTQSGCPYCSGRYAIAGETDLVTLYPDIAEEWDYSKNEKKPESMKPSSHDKVWWKCKTCGNEWKAVISSRTNGCGCPQCGKEAIVKSRSTPARGKSLADLFPQLVREWNIEKNMGLSCDAVSAYSHQMVWWKCQKGHEWKAIISNRTKGRNCPYCSNKKIVVGENDFATVYSELAEEWNYEKNGDILPSQITPSSSKKVWWRCKECGHEWIASINNRIKRGCPECSKARRVSFPEKVLVFYLRKMYEQVIENYRPDFLEGRELDVFIPAINVAIEYDGTFYHQNTQRDLDKINLCKEKGITLLRIREPGCPSLTGDNGTIITMEKRNTEAYEKMVLDLIDWLIENELLSSTLLDVDIKRDTREINQLVNYQNVDNSLCVTNPELIEFWNTERNREFTMEKISHASDKCVWWYCKDCGHEWYKSVYSMSRKKGKKLCPQCKRGIVE